MEKQALTRKTKQVLVAILVGIMVVIIGILILLTLNFSLFVNTLIFWFLTTFYALFAFFLVDAPVIKINPEKTIEKPVYRDVIRVVEKPIIKEIQIPMENKVIEVVEKEVIKEVPVERIIYQTIEKKPTRLNIPKFEFIGSTQTKTYHKRNCKFSKMLKRKYKLHSNSKAFFKRKHYKACKACINK